MKTEYPYKELRSSLSIRLLKLCPKPLNDAKSSRRNTRTDSTTGNTFTFELVTTTLDDAPPYEAVSYVWDTGPHREKLPIAKEGCLMITRLLSEAVQQLASAATTEYLWIDQICINQKSNEEKNHQVSVMRDIYKRCKRVMIYLAPNLYPVGLQKPVWKQSERYYSYDGGRVSFKQVVTEIVHLQDTLFRQGTPNSDLSYADFSGWAKQRWSNFGADSSIWVSFYLLYRHPWFYRGWVFQEAVLAPKARILACELELDPYFVIWASQQAESQEALSLGSLPKSISLLGSSVGCTRFQETIDFKSKDPLYVLDTLCPRSNFTLAVDYVYGFLGIMNRPFITPDYNLTWINVFTRATANIIDHEGTLRIFGYLNRLPGRARSVTLPSWVPSWGDRRVSKELLTTSNKYTAFTVCRKRKHVLPASNDLPYLRVRGGCIDRISKVLAGGDSGNDVEAFVDFLQTATQLTQDNNRSGSPSGKYGAAHDARSKSNLKLRSLLRSLKLHHSRDANSAKFTSDPFERLLLLASQSKGLGTACKQSSKDVSPMFPNLRQVHRRRPGLEMKEHVLDELQALYKFMDQQTAFITDDGLLGCSRARMKIESGDLVCILHGLQVPIILTKREQLSETFPNGWRIVDLCHVENTIKGEAVTWAEDEAEEFLLC